QGQPAPPRPAHSAEARPDPPQGIRGPLQGNRDGAPQGRQREGRQGARGESRSDPQAQGIGFSTQHSALSPAETRRPENRESAQICCREIRPFWHSTGGGLHMGAKSFKDLIVWQKADALSTL